MKCPKCGAELEDDAFFCDKCGSVVSADTDAIDLFSASEEKDDESGSLDFKAGDTSAHSGGGDFFSKLHKSGGVAAKTEPAEETSGGNFYNNVSRSGILNNGVNDRAADAENAEMAAAAAGFYSNTGKSDAINNGMNSRATDAESAEMAAVAAGFYSNTGKSEAISNGMNSRSADAESPEVVAAAAGFYSSANKGKTTDANNSVVFDAKIDDDELSQISIDKTVLDVKEVTDIAPDLYHGKLDVPDEELEQEDESKYAADLVTGEIKVSEEEQAQENEEESKYAADLVSGPLNVPDEELAQEDESKYAADLVTGKLDIPDEELAQEDESQYAAKLNTDEIKDDENSEESELDKKIQEDTSKAVGEGTAEQKKNEGKESSAEKVNLIQVLVNFFREITSENVEEEEIEADDVQGNFEYLSGSAENDMKGYLPLCFAPMASLLLLGFVEGLVRVIIELAGFGALIGAFVKTPKMRMKIAQAFAKTDVFNFTRYVSEIKKQMNSALVFSAIGLVIMICSLIDDGGQVQNLVLLLGILISSLGYCLAVNSGVRCIIVKDAFAKIREEKRPKKTYTDQVNIACFALCIVALLVFVFVKFAGVI
ncbi:MAG: zinc-ribbon domain-containing protein [Ruminobacter sp.]|nr:zinc-ribbon domain-containing protein [Ruminobacter sp.]